MRVIPNPRVSTGLPSPTLTDPEMILPDNSPSIASSPSTSRQHQRLPSPPPMESIGHGRSVSAPDEKSRLIGAMYSPFRNGVLRRHHGSTTRRSSSEKGENRIAFEKTRLSYQQSGEVPFASSPTLHDDPNRFGQRIYTESTQGDYENGEGTYSTPAILEEDENDPYSHAAMTRRAEEILANAKIRLTNMEGNLNRARSTLGVRSSSSMSSFGNRSPEPVSLYTLSGKGRKPGGFSPSNHRQAHQPSPEEAKQGHSRVFSETAVPSSLQTGLLNGHSTGEDTGDSNGLGNIGTDAYPPDRHSEPSRNWFWNGLTRNTSISYANRHANGLQALNEDGPATESFEQRAAREEVIEEEGRSIDLQSPTAAAFNAKNPPTVGLTRARSTAQMHDLREQMQDLKGKISTLKQRAKEDNLRRRSMQSLRTPSPFTAAEQWYTGTPSPEDMGRVSSSGSGPIREAQGPHNSEDHSRNVPRDSGHASPEEPVIKDSHKIPEGEVAPSEDPSDEPFEENDDPIKDLAEGEFESVNGFPSQKERLVLVDEPPAIEVILDHGNEAVVEVDSAAESETKEDSLYDDQDYHETFTSPIITKHEDREDAFDYEHYILTSAMGSYTGIGVRRSSSMRKRSSSLNSESSAETTKPRNSMGDDTAHVINGRHGRQDSMDSVSTDNTFATANEVNDYSDSSQDDRTPRKPPTPSWRPEPPRKHKPNGSNESAPDRLQSNGLQKHDSKKHIVSAQKGYTNGISRKPTPITENPGWEPPDLLTVLSATTSWQEGAPPLRLDLGDRDRELVERLVKSLAKVCSQVHSLGPEGSKYEARVFRRKMDAARRVLDGEMNGEAF